MVRRTSGAPPRARRRTPRSTRDDRATEVHRTGLAPARAQRDAMRRARVPLLRSCRNIHPRAAAGAPFTRRARRRPGRATAAPSAPRASTRPRSASPSRPRRTAPRLLSVPPSPVRRPRSGGRPHCDGRCLRHHGRGGSVGRDHRLPPDPRFPRQLASASPLGRHRWRVPARWDLRALAGVAGA